MWGFFLPSFLKIGKKKKKKKTCHRTIVVPQALSVYEKVRLISTCRV